jgi:hypothetical protein
MSTNPPAQSRKEYIKNASDTLLGVYADLDLGEKIYEIADTLYMNDERRIAFTHLVGDVILGVISEQNFIQQTTQHIGLSEAKASEIKQALDVYFRKAETARGANSQIPPANNELKEKLELRPEVPTPKPYTREVGADGRVKPLTREEVLQALTSKRTMASDIASIQEHISVPTVDTPRWGSDDGVK